MDALKKIYKKNNDIVSRMIAGETILVPVKNNMGDLENIYTLNEVGSLIWNLLDGKKSFENILNVIIDEFDISRKEAEKDLIYFLKTLEEINSVQSV